MHQQSHPKLMPTVERTVLFGTTIRADLKSDDSKKSRVLNTL